MSNRNLYRACTSEEALHLHKNGNYAETFPFSQDFIEAVELDLSQDGTLIKKTLSNLKEQVLSKEPLKGLKETYEELKGVLFEIGKFHTDSNFFSRLSEELLDGANLAMYASQSTEDKHRQNVADYILPSNTFTYFPMDQRINNVLKGYGFTKDYEIAKKHMEKYDYDCVIEVSFPESHIITDLSKISHNPEGNLVYGGVDLKSCLIDFSTYKAYRQTNYNETEKEVGVLFDVDLSKKAPIEVFGVK